MMGFGHGMMGGGFSIIFWILIIGVVYYFFKEYNRSNHHRNGDHRYNNSNHDRPKDKDRSRFDNLSDYQIDVDSAEEIARQRYAKGEISEEELKEILANLNN